MIRPLACLLLAALPGLTLAAEGDVIRILNWNDYIAPQVLTDFEQQTGIKVDYKTFSSIEELFAAMDANEPFDIVVPSNDNLPALIKAGKLIPLDQTKLTNRANLDKSILNKLSAFDPKNQYAVPYLWGSVGLAMNKPKAEAAFGGPLPNSWSVLFDPAQSAKLASCGISILDAPVDLSTIFMNYKGRILADSSPRQINKAYKSLEPIRPNIRMIDSEHYIDELSAGNLCVSVAYVGDALTAEAAGQPVEFSIPKEGSVMFVDSMVIPKASTHPDLALQFVNYMLQPEVIAKVSNETFYPNANDAANQFLDESLRGKEGITVDKETRRRLSLMPELSEATDTLVNSLWTSFRDQSAPAKAP